VDKLYVEEEELLLDGFRLGTMIYRSGFRPDFIVGLWRRGSAVGIVVQECLQHLGVDTDHISIRTSYRGMDSYRRMIDQAQDIRVHGTQYLLENLNADDALLIVDDVYSTGLNVHAVIARLSQRTKRNMPSDVRVAVPWYKPTSNRTSRVPDYFLHETDRWLVLPYELKGLTTDQLAAHKPFVQPFIDEVSAYLDRHDPKTTP
jgi:hypothetical protein